MDIPTTLGRRRLFEAGAATAAGVALGISAEVVAAGATAAEPGDVADVFGSARTSPFTIPNPIAGTKSITLGFGEFGSFTFGAPSTAVHLSAGRYYSPQSRLILPITLPVGTVVRRVDVFGGTTKPTSWVVTRSGPAGGNETMVDAPASAELVLSITPTDQTPLAPGHVLSLIGIGVNDAQNFGHAAIVHYVEPSDSLAILPTIVRIYDSRPNEPPTTGPKGVLGNNATRRLLTTAAGVPAGRVPRSSTSPSSPTRRRGISRCSAATQSGRETRRSIGIIRNRSSPTRQSSRWTRWEVSRRKREEAQISWLM